MEIIKELLTDLVPIEFDTTVDILGTITMTKEKDAGVAIALQLATRSETNLSGSDAFYSIERAFRGRMSPPPIGSRVINLFLISLENQRDLLIDGDKPFTADEQGALVLHHVHGSHQISSNLVVDGVPQTAGERVSPIVMIKEAMTAAVTGVLPPTQGPRGASAFATSSVYSQEKYPNKLPAYTSHSSRR